MNVDTGMQIDLLSTVRRRAWLMASVGGIVFLLGYWVAMALPNEYMSYSTLLVEPQAISQQLVEAGVAESDLNQRLHLMTSEILSRPRLSRIIDELGLYREESQSMLREEIIDLMRSKVAVVPVLPEFNEDIPARQRDRMSLNTFRILFTSGNASTAAAVAQRLANDFIDQHVAARVQTTQKSLEFIGAEQERLRVAIVDVDRRIAEVKAANPGRLPEDQSTNQRILERTLSEMRDAQRVLDQARSEEAFWKNQVLTATSTAARDDASPSRKLQVLDLVLAEMRSKGMTDKHPDVIATRQEMAELREAIEAAGGEEEETLSPAQQTARSEEKRAALRVAAAAQEVQRLTDQRQEVEKRLEETPRVAEQLDALMREYTQLTMALADFGQRRQEASVQADLERRQLGEQFRVLESAFPAPEPSAPNRLLLLGMSLVAGLAFGSIAGLVVELLDGSVHGARELQGALGVPVLASIPSILLESDRAARTRRRFQLALAAATFTVFCLVGGAATYMWVNGAPGFVQALLAGEEEPEQGASIEIPGGPVG
ncbi:MAG: GumC family protein [Myxococcota bacterium]